MRRIQKPHATRKLHGFMFYRTRVIADRSIFTLREYEFFNLFCSCDLDLDRMTFIYELEPYSRKIIPYVQIWTSYIKTFESYRLTWDRQTVWDRQTYRHDRDYLPCTLLRKFASGQQYLEWTYSQSTAALVIWLHNTAHSLHAVGCQAVHVHVASNTTWPCSWLCPSLDWLLHRLHRLLSGTFAD